MSSAISEAVSSAADGIVDSFLYGFVYKLLYWIAAGLVRILQILYSVFQVFAGVVKVNYDGAQGYLTDVFFSSSLVSNVYWGMALIGLVLCFAFAILSVTRKMFDADQAQKHSMGQILGNTLKSGLIIVSLSAIMTVTLNATNLLLERTEYLFSNAGTIGTSEKVEFDEMEYAAMARILNTIGNYSLNPSYNSRYNINSCYNELRSDLDYLHEQGVFDVYYEVSDANGNKVVSWQSAIQKLVNASDPERELKLDVYNEEVTSAITYIMDEMRTDASFAPLKDFQSAYSVQKDVPLDTLIFLMGTMRAARNPDYNSDVSLTDPVRGPYYIGEKSIYDLDSVNADFDIAPTDFDYIIVYIAAVMLLIDLARVVLMCAARIFNLLLLYIAAPPIIAAMPLDDGGKFRQWITAFLIQCFGVFASVLSMRIFIMFLPIIFSGKLVLFESAFLDEMAKLILLLGAGWAVKHANGMITGILADNAGMAAIQAGDQSGRVDAVGRMGWGAVKMAAGGALWTAAAPFRAVKGAFSGGGSSGSSGSGSNGSNGGGGGGSGSDSPASQISEPLPEKKIPPPPPMPVRNDQGKYVPTPPPMPGKQSASQQTSGSRRQITPEQYRNLFGPDPVPKAPPMPTGNGSGKYVPTPPPMPGKQSAPRQASGTRSQITPEQYRNLFGPDPVPKAPPMPTGNGSGKYVPEPPPMPEKQSAPQQASSARSQITPEQYRNLFGPDPVPKAPPMPTGNGSGKYVPEPPPIPDKQTLPK